MHHGDRLWVNTLRLRQNGRHFADDIFKCISLNENVWILLKISLIFVPKGPINNIPTLVQVMAKRHPGDKPLSEPMMVSLSTHICVTRPQWVKVLAWSWIAQWVCEWDCTEVDLLLINSFCAGICILYISQHWDGRGTWNKQRVLMHRHQGWNVRHGLCHIYMRYLYIYELFIAFVCFVVCSLL